jgi:hypothetical protein
MAPRYHYCVQVDDIALKSILECGKNDVGYRGQVNLINVYWSFPNHDEAERKEAEEAKVDLIDEGEPPIEGCRLYDVGWMRYDIRDMLISLYGYSVRDRVREDWYYERPPRVWKGPSYVDASEGIPLPKE